jgi:hypothetical protein
MPLWMGEGVTMPEVIVAVLLAPVPAVLVPVADVTSSLSGSPGGTPPGNHEMQ